MSFEQVDVLGVKVDSVRSTELLSHIDDVIRNGAKEIFAYVNVHAVNIAQRLPWFRDFLNNAEIAYADGEGIRLGARLLGVYLPEKIALTRKIWDIVSLCESNKYPLYLLGSTPENVQHASENILRRHPEITVSFRHGFFSDAENESVISGINAFSPGVLIVGLGMPKQEAWILKNRDRLNVNAILSGGACIDFAAGAKSLCPEWISKIGFEWLFRFVFEPKRLFRRYFAGNPTFLLKILIQRLLQGKQQHDLNAHEPHLKT